MNLNGEKSLPKKSADVWPKLNDMQFLVNCLPDLHLVKKVEAQSAEATLRPGFSFARSEMQLRIEQVDTSPPISARYRFTTKGIGSSSAVAARFELIDQPDGCALKWEATVEQLGGLLKAVPHGLIQAGAEKVINDLLANIASKIAT